MLDSRENLPVDLPIEGEAGNRPGLQSAPQRPLHLSESGESCRFDSETPRRLRNPVPVGEDLFKRLHPILRRQSMLDHPAEDQRHRRDPVPNERMGAVDIVKCAENFARLKRRHQFGDARQVDWNNPHLHSFRRQASINSPTSAVARHSTVSAAP